MKSPILTSPEMAPAILIHTGTAPAMSIGLVRGDPQNLGIVQATLERLFNMPVANTAIIMAMIMGIMAGVILLTSPVNWRLGGTLILACIGFYGFAALYAIQAVALMRH